MINNQWQTKSVFLFLLHCVCETFSNENGIISLFWFSLDISRCFFVLVFSTKTLLKKTLIWFEWNKNPSIETMTISDHDLFCFVLNLSLFWQWQCTYILVAIKETRNRKIYLNLKTRYICVFCCCVSINKYPILPLNGGRKQTRKRRGKNFDFCIFWREREKWLNKRFSF